MPDPIRVTSTVSVPGRALSFKATRASGPGGQNVNKVSSKVELRVDLARVEGLTAAALARLQRATANARDDDGQWIVVSQRTRDQHRNLEDAREKVRRAVERALVAPRARRATKPTATAKQKRVLAKKHAGEIKRARGLLKSLDDE
jgi:ribosome-associated protein